MWHQNLPSRCELGQTPRSAPLVLEADDFIRLGLAFASGVMLILFRPFQKGDFIALLEQNERRDLIFQYTTVGAHKDDLLFNLNGNPVKKYGSQGQQKSFILALRLAQYHYLHSHSGKKPVLLLDDIFDKLDHSRVQKIIDLVSNEVFGQVIITDTEKTRLEELLVNRVSDFRIFELPLTATP